MTTTAKVLIIKHNLKNIIHIYLLNNIIKIIPFKQTQYYNWSRNRLLRVGAIKEVEVEWEVKFYNSAAEYEKSKKESGIIKRIKRIIWEMNHPIINIENTLVNLETK